MQFIDTHTHPYLFKKELAPIVDAAEKAGITHWISVAIDLETTLKGLQIHEEFPHILPTIGVHPCEAHHDVDFDRLTPLLENKDFVAIGEIGLDYHWYPDQKEAQEECLVRQLEWARDLKKPVIIHNRKADEDIIRVTNKYPDVTMVFHCFCSDESFVERTISENRYYSVTGLITYSKKGKTIRAVKKIPIEHIMLETDCPYLSPKNHQKSDNEPAFIPEIAQRLAEVKDYSLADIALITTRNARRFFNIQS